MSYLKYLESEAMEIFRTSVRNAKNPVLLTSLGKDSAVMLHLAKKAFWPEKLPMKLLHVDTLWKFQEMYQFRNSLEMDPSLDLKIYTNEEGVKNKINPFNSGAETHTRIMKTEALIKALDSYGFDVIYGGARRDEEKSRAKERIFSFRSQYHVWDPRNQSPELFNIYNTLMGDQETIRVFPLSNWTELDVWKYIEIEKIPIIELYFAKKRKVYETSEGLFLADDDRVNLSKYKTYEEYIRFRTLGCYPLTAAIKSKASTVSDIIVELLNTNSSERSGRVIDSIDGDSMEKKKKEGYF